MVGNVIVRVGADVNKLKQDLVKGQKALQSFKSNVVKIAGLTSIAMFGKAAITDAMAYEAALQQVNRIMGDSAKDFVKWSNEQAISLNMSRLEAVKYGSVYGNLISGISKDSAETTDRTKQLLKASSIVASATGREMTDVMERIRSGLLGNTESIEDLGINVNIAMIESTDAFKKFANGKSWQQLSFQTQQQIRLFAILEQTTKKYGDSVSANTSSSLAQFIATMKNVQLNIGIAFMPIINIVLPILTSFAQSLEYVTRLVAQFTAALFGGNKTQIQSSSSAKDAAKAQTNLGTAAKKAGKDASKAVAGFDEVNTLQEKIADSADDAADSMGAVGSSIAPTTPQTDSLAGPISPGVQTAVDTLKNTFQTLKDTLSNYQFNFMDGLNTSVTNLSKTLETFLSTQWNIFKLTVLDVLESKDYSISINNIKTAIENTGNAVKNALDVFNEFYKILNEALTNSTPNLVAGLSNLTEGFLKLGTAVVEVSTAIVKDGFDVISKALSQNSDNFTNILTPAYKAFGDILNITGDIFKGLADVIKKAYDDNIAPLKQLWLDVFGVFMDSVDKLLNEWIYPLFLPAIEELKNNISPAFEEIKKSVSESIGIAIEIMKIWWNEYLKPLVLWFQDNIIPILAPIFTEIGKHIGDVVGSAIEIFKDFFRLIKEVLTFVKDVFKGDWDKAWTDVGAIFKTIWEGLVNVARIPINTIIRMINNMLSMLNNIKINIPKVDIPGIGVMGGGTIAFPQIPLLNEIPVLDSGGIITSPTLAQLSKNGKPEAIVPLENTSFVDTLASAIGSAVLSAMQFSNQGQQGSNGQVVINVDSTQLARVMIPAFNKENQRTGNFAIVQGV